MKGVLSKILRLVFVVLLIINTVPRNLYADGEETAPAEQESIVEPAADPEPEPAKPEQHAEPEIPAWASQITADIADLKKALYAVNVMASAQPEQKSADDVLMAAMKGGK